MDSLVTIQQILCVIPSCVHDKFYAKFIVNSFQGGRAFKVIRACILSYRYERYTTVN